MLDGGHKSDRWAFEFHAAFVDGSLYDWVGGWLLPRVEKDELDKKTRKMISITRRMERHVADNMGHIGPSNHIEAYYWIAVDTIKKNKEVLDLNSRDPMIES